MAYHNEQTINAREVHDLKNNWEHIIELYISEWWIIKRMLHQRFLMHTSQDTKIVSPDENYLVHNDMLR